MKTHRSRSRGFADIDPCFYVIGLGLAMVAGVIINAVATLPPKLAAPPAIHREEPAFVETMPSTVEFPG